MRKRFDTNERHYVASAHRVEELTFKELHRQHVSGLRSAGRSCETHYKPLFNPETLERITEREHKTETYFHLGSLHFRAYCNLRKQGYAPEDIAGFMVLSYEGLTEEREIFKRQRSMFFQ